MSNRIVNAVASESSSTTQKAMLQTRTSRAAMVAQHVATCGSMAYDNLEKDLLQPIEAVTKTQRKVLGPNMFERKATKVLQGNR